MTGKDNQPAILLVIAPYVDLGREHVRSHLGLGAALALGRVRVVTDPCGLRGWRIGTLVEDSLWPTLSPDCRADFRVALDVYMSTGRLRYATADDMIKLLDEVLA
ncbi:hypothetical protein [Ciceribacter ferrooxidans]|uniref:Uncharacterized protein n=1 Tax=Ciceribacter ferrooxidans TaxID=2509717 RepID=A0A4Q2SVQ7_9HYPH|nr:hypothetical protein [Ciceribacter ferrooxidans]RYC10155.1 hypothetical protein EUU22_19000 [Ciceribacter ferrooxidans]